MKPQEKFTFIPARIRCDWFKSWKKLGFCDWYQGDGTCGHEPGPEKCHTKGREIEEKE